MQKKEFTVKELVERQEKRREYHREYMKKQRDKGIHRKKPIYVKGWSKDKIDLSYDCRSLFAMLNKAREIETQLIKDHKKEINRLLKVIEKLQVEATDKQNLINKYQLSQEYMLGVVQEQTTDIDLYIQRIRDLVKVIEAYKQKLTKH